MDLSALHPINLLPDRDYFWKDKLNILTGHLDCGPRNGLVGTTRIFTSVYQLGHCRLYQLFKKESKAGVGPQPFAYIVNYPGFS